MQLSKVCSALYERVTVKDKKNYQEWPEFYQELLYCIIAEVETYCSSTFNVAIDTALDEIIVHKHPNVIMVSDRLLMLERDIAAMMIAYEAAHLLYEHDDKGMSRLTSDHEAYIFAIGFLTEYRYNLPLVKEHALGVLRKDCSEKGRLLTALVNKEFDRELACSDRIKL